ncbi:helix-turn-helix domain-containing protein [bacterium]|nr:MAG: helix-turn-helix domain-containing protein [bacterium]
MALRDRHKPEEEKIMDVDAAMSGSLTFRDPVNLRINGKFEGTLETKGNLVIGPQAVVNAQIIGDEIVVAGRLKGEILAKKKLTLLDSAVAEIKVRTAKLTVHEGAIFEGVCHMLGENLSVDDLARYLEVDMSSIVEWANSGKIPAIKEQDTWRFERKSIDEWIAAGKVR